MENVYKERSAIIIREEKRRYISSKVKEKKWLTNIEEKFKTVSDLRGRFVY